jgi:putative spermidine/putrescine transport system substrate-binding protein
MKTRAKAALSVVLAFSVAAAAWAEGSGAASSGKRTLVVSTWGLGEDVLWQDVYAPFETKYDCKVVLETGTTAERYTKLAANPNSTVDVIELSQKAAADGYAAKLFAKLDYAKVANARYLIPGAKAMTSSGYGPAYTVNSVGIVYNPRALKFEIKGWGDLWRPELANKISIPSLQTTFGPAMVYIAADYAKVSVGRDKGAAAFKALASLKPNIVKTYDKSSDLANMFASGEIVAAVVGDFAIPVIAKALPEAKYLVPASGTYANFNTIDVVAGSKNQDLAYAYINWRISKELQSKTAVSLNEAPINSTVELSAAQAANKTYGEVARRAKPIDYVLVNPLMGDWTDQWNRTLND